MMAEDLVEWVKTHRRHYYNQELVHLYELCDTRSSFLDMAVMHIRVFANKEDIPDAIGYDYDSLSGYLANSNQMSSVNNVHDRFYDELILGKYNIHISEMTFSCQKVVLRWCLASAYLPSLGVGKWVEYQNTYVYPLPELTGKQTVTLAEVRDCVNIRLKHEHAAIRCICAV